MQQSKAKKPIQTCDDPTIKFLLKILFSVPYLFVERKICFSKYCSIYTSPIWKRIDFTSRNECDFCPGDGKLKLQYVEPLHEDVVFMKYPITPSGFDRYNSWNHVNYCIPLEEALFIRSLILKLLISPCHSWDRKSEYKKMSFF